MLHALLVCSLLSAEPQGLDGVDGERLSLIKTLEADEAARASIWRWGWGGGYLALTLGQAIAVPFLTDPGARVDFIVGAASSAVGAALQIFLPLSVIAGSRTVRALPGTSEGLAEAERVLEADAANEDFSISWVMHLGNVLFNVATGLVLGLGWQRWESAAYNVGIGIAVGEVMVLTTPHNLRALTRPPPLVVTPLVGPDLRGLAVGARW